MLWERGWIDENNALKYKKLCVDEDGEEIEEYSMLRLMESCLDFANEITEMEVVGKELGCSIVCTTKYHAELAG